MKRFLSWALGLPAAIVAIAFALANRSMATVSFDPISPDAPWLAFSVPIWSILFAGVFLGLIIGWIGAWINQSKWRQAAHQARVHLEEEMAKKSAIEKRLNNGELVPLDNQQML